MALLRVLVCAALAAPIVSPAGAGAGGPVAGGPTVRPPAGDEETTVRRAAPPSAPAPYVESVDVSLVLVPVVVRDASGRPVTDLTVEDFLVLEEGRPQGVAAFGREARPVSILLALDTSPSMRPYEMAAKRAALEFVRGQREGTAFALSVFNDGVFLEADFTKEPKEVESAIGALRPAGEQTALYDAVVAAARHLEGRGGARVAVVFTDGTDTVHPQDVAEARLEAAIEDAARRDVTVYTVSFGARAALGILQRISDVTGGELFSAATERDLTAAFAQVGESVGNRYLLGYPPPRGGAPGFRRIDVSVKRPGLRVAARRGYYSR